MPIFKRLPKRGFSNFDFERRFYIVNHSDLDMFDNGTTVDTAALVEKGLIPDDKLPVKILGNGKVTKKLTIVAAWYSKSAHEGLTSSGGIANNAKGEAFAFPKPKKKFIKREPVAKAKPAEGEAAAPAPVSPAEAAPEAPKAE
jgi:hypothetical protein